MPLNQEAVTLDPGPSCVRDARRWAARSCRALGRDELVETAELGTSELVANALLHALAPIGLRMRGTREHPRIEVLDGSGEPPLPNPRMIEDDGLLTTVGRGLGIVAMCATAWGAEIQRRGKVVWFEPADRIADKPALEGDIFDPSEAPGPAEGPVDGHRVRLLGVPVDLYADFQRHYLELRRELRLLALAHGDTYPVATSLSKVFQTFDDELRRAEGIDELEAILEDAPVDRDDVVDVTLTVPRSGAHTAARLIEVLELADAFCRSERLLALATTRAQRDFQRWYLGEFVRQADGVPAQRWVGAPTPAGRGRG